MIEQNYHVSMWMCNEFFCLNSKVLMNLLLLMYMLDVLIIILSLRKLIKQYLLILLNIIIHWDKITLYFKFRFLQLKLHLRFQYQF